MSEPMAIQREMAVYAEALYLGALPNREAGVPYLTDMLELNLVVVPPSELSPEAAPFCAGPILRPIVLSPNKELRD